MATNAYVQFIAVVLLSVLVHIVLGWAWTLGAGIVAGLWVARRPLLVGMLGVGSGWLLLVAYNMAVAPEATGEFFRVFGALMGGMPGFVTGLLTVGIGLVLGLLGALIGWQVQVLALEDEPVEDQA